MNINVGIISAPSLTFCLQGAYQMSDWQGDGQQEVACQDGKILWQGKFYDELFFSPQSSQCTFSLHHVTIGIRFHWEREETQTFSGALHIILHEGILYAINHLPVEDYLTSVISSEMKATCSLEFLKASAVISRSWLYAQMAHQPSPRPEPSAAPTAENSIIRWYDHQSHTLFDVCADDHCQRYQGLTRILSHTAIEAVEQTRGQILTYQGEVCDARFSKCCGGQTNEYRFCWQDREVAYLRSIKDPFCQMADGGILHRILNDYDLETRHFYQWTVELEQEKIKVLISRFVPEGMGDILDLIPLEKGPGGHISLLRIVGSNRTIDVGRELEIRHWLSPTHLQSSAFQVSKKMGDGGIPSAFMLIGKGWGHGVGMCQIGAAVMGEQGYNYRQILEHYFPGAELSSVDCIK